MYLEEIKLEWIEKFESIGMKFSDKEKEDIRCMSEDELHKFVDDLIKRAHKVINMIKKERLNIGPKEIN